MINGQIRQQKDSLEHTALLNLKSWYRIHTIPFLCNLCIGPKVRLFHNFKSERLQNSNLTWTRIDVYFINNINSMTKVASNAGKKEGSSTATTSSNPGQSNANPTDQGEVPVVATDRCVCKQQLGGWRPRSIKDFETNDKNEQDCRSHGQKAGYGGTE